MILALCLALVQENPADAWKDFKEGSWATYKRTVKGQASTVTLTLKKKGEEAYDVDSDSDKRVTGMRLDAKFHGRVGELGDETIKVDGKSFKCRIIDYFERVGVTQETSTRRWICKDAPGTVVKVDAKTKIPGTCLPEGTWELKKLKDEVTVGKKKVACWTMTSGAGTAWYSKDVPGWLVKLDLKKETLTEDVETESWELQEWGTK